MMARYVSMTGQGTRRTAAIGVAALASLALLAGCGSSSSGGGSKDAAGPILVGSLNALSGPIVNPFSPQAAKAVFDDVNEHGGINGRKIKYVALDDKSDPATSAQGARRLVTQEKAVAIAGGFSFTDCSVNAKYYAQVGIADINIGPQAQCYQSANISPVSLGPFTGTTLTLYYASEKQHLTDLCAFVVQAPGSGPSYDAAIARWKSITGKTLLTQTKVPFNVTDWAPYVIKAKAAGCKAFFTNVSQPGMQSITKAAVAQNVASMKVLTLASAYEGTLGDALGERGEGILVNSEYAPYTDPDAPGVAQWSALMKKHGVSLTAFSEGGYLAATDLVTVLKSMKGAITRQTVLKALQTMKQPIANPLVGSPWIFGPGTAHASNTAGAFVTLKDRKWTSLGGYVKLPAQ